MYNSNTSKGTNESTKTNKVPTFILSYDGVVANTASTRASIAIEAALETWPQLRQNSVLQQSTDLSWLTNKIEALLHVTQSSNEGLMGCEAVILARMLMEEQMLDEGRSIGKSGKYASKFHPTSTNENTASENRRRNRNGSRPLTVGEIAANWEANLVDSLFVKYNIHGKSPLPTIRENIIRLIQEKAKHTPPTLIPEVAEALSLTGSKVYIIVTHPSQIKLAEASLSPKLSSQVEHQKIVLVAPKDDCEAQDDIIQRLVSEEEKGSSIVVVQSVFKTLVRAKRLLGDDSPRFIDGFGDCTVGDEIKISFSLPLWGDNTDPQQQNDAIMNPWLDVMSKDSFLDLMGYKIKTSSSR